MSDKIAKGWSLSRFAKHYVRTISKPMSDPDYCRSAIFGDAKNILLIASIRFGTEKAQRIFAAHIERATAALKGQMK